MQADFYRQPFRYEAYKKTAAELAKSYPFLELFSIGKSVLGRELYAFGIGPARATVLYVGGVHGMEWLTSLLLMRFLQDLCHSIATNAPLAEIDISRSLDHRSVTVIPCLNPDGIEIAQLGACAAGPYAALVETSGDSCRWQANAHGIDLNHNFDAGFRTLQAMERENGFCAPGPTRYGGPYAFSEPESLSLASFCKAFPPQQAYAFHSQGEEIYYEYGVRTPSRSRIMAQLLAGASGYRLASPQGLASHGGFKDWFIEYFGAPAFTIEIGRGENPLPIEELEPIYAHLLEMLLISILL